MSELRRSKIASETQISSTAPVYTFAHTSTAASDLTQTSSAKNAMFTYDLRDIRTSLFVSVALLLANTVIFFLVKNNVISLALLGL